MSNITKGTKVKTLVDLIDNDEHDQERITPAGSVGTIQEEDRGSWSVHFDNGAALNFSAEELADETQCEIVKDEPRYIDVTPTWGEIGLLFYRLATSKEVKAIKAGRSEFARAFALAQAVVALKPTLTDAQQALLAKVITEELTKQGF